ncbi:MAG: hypothetical protein PHE89_06925 [Alphaproteobacteria bacterium]|nr:hypothetical protein [Alphaproteobacteria bacterium]
MKLSKTALKKPIRSRKVSHELSFKELAFVYEHLKDINGTVALKALDKELASLDKLYVDSFAEFAKVIKSSSNAYQVLKKQ